MNQELLRVNGLTKYYGPLAALSPERQNLADYFKETVAARVQSDPAFAQALLDEAITLFVNGEPESAKLILRDLVNATVGFEALADEIHKPAKSLHRMLSRCALRL